jgi:localization factor PodJL
MSAGVPWSVSAVDPDTWEAAREAARRDGLSVGEWLEAAIRENARGGHGRGRNPATNFDHRLDDLAEQINMIARRNVYARPNAPQPVVRDHGSEHITASIDALTDRIDQMLEGMERAQRNNGRDEISSAIRKLDSRIESILIERPAKDQDQEVDTKLDEMARVISQMSERLEREVTASAMAPNAQQIPTADELDAAVAEIMERQSMLDGTPMRRLPARSAPPVAPTAPSPQFAQFERQLKTIADEMQSIRKTSAKNAQASGPITELRRDIAELARSMTELAPRRTLESLEQTVEALTRKIDRSANTRQDHRSAQAVLTALDEIREALANVRPQESFISVEGDLNALSEKLDVINAKSIDGTTVARIQNQMQEVRDLLSNALPAENLQAVVAQIETIAGKVDRISAPDDSGVRNIVGALEQRIDALAHRIEQTAQQPVQISQDPEAFDRIHQRLDSLQTSLDKAENPMGLEDTMRSVVERLDASEAKLNNLGAIERGISDLSSQFDKARANAMDVAERAAKTALRELQAGRQQMPQQVAAAQQQEIAPPPLKPLAGDPMPRRVTQVAAPSETQERFTRTAPVTVQSREVFVATDGMPADHPLEPGSGAPRSRATPVQQRIAQSEAAVADITPRTNDANTKTSDFIAAARRAAQAAAAEAPDDTVAGGKKKGALSGIFARSRRAVLLGLVVAMLGFSAVRFFDVSLITNLIGGNGRETSVAPSPAPAPVPAPPEQTPAAPQNPTAAPDPQQRSFIPNFSDPFGPLAPTGDITPQNMVSMFAQPDQIITQSTKQAPRTQQTPLQTQNTVAHNQPQTPSAEEPKGINASLMQAANGGDADAAYEVGERYLMGRGVDTNLAEALKWFEKAVAKGSPAAAFRLGMAYEKGQGVTKDRARARTNYVLAADSGHLKAMHNLAVLMVEDGAASKKPDYASAIPWFRKAAERGLRDSQYNLGVIYARGMGASQNLAESFLWFSLAANQGDVDAAKKRDDVASRLDQQTLVAARLAVQTWTAKPSDESVNAPRVKPEWQNAAVAPKKKQKK